MRKINEGVVITKCLSRGTIRQCFVFAVTVAMAPFAVAMPVGDCAGTPADAEIELPSPLSKWGEINCTPYGHVLGAKRGWVWSYPGALSPVFVPSQMVRDNPAAVGNKSYFKSIKLVKVEGEDFQRAYGAYQSGFADEKVPPEGYRLDIVSVSGRSLTLYFFDYGVYAWGIWCSTECDTKSRFMILDMSKRPGPREGVSKGTP